MYNQEEALKKQLKVAVETILTGGDTKDIDENLLSAVKHIGTIAKREKLYGGDKVGREILIELNGFFQDLYNFAKQNYKESFNADDHGNLSILRQLVWDTLLGENIEFKYKKEDRNLKSVLHKLAESSFKKKVDRLDNVLGTALTYEKQAFVFFYEPLNESASESTDITQDKKIKEDMLRTIESVLPNGGQNFISASAAKYSNVLSETTQTPRLEKVLEDISESLKTLTATDFSEEKKTALTDELLNLNKQITDTIAAILKQVPTTDSETQKVIDRIYTIEGNIRTNLMGQCMKLFDLVKSELAKINSDISEKHIEFQKNANNQQLLEEYENAKEVYNRFIALIPKIQSEIKSYENQYTVVATSSPDLIMIREALKTLLNTLPDISKNIAAKENALAESYRKLQFSELDQLAASFKKLCSQPPHNQQQKIEQIIEQFNAVINSFQDKSAFLKELMSNGNLELKILCIMANGEEFVKTMSKAEIISFLNAFSKTAYVSMPDIFTKIITSCFFNQFSEDEDYLAAISNVFASITNLMVADDIHKAIQTLSRADYTLSAETNFQNSAVIIQLITNTLNLSHFDYDAAKIEHFLQKYDSKFEHLSAVVDQLEIKTVDKPEFKTIQLGQYELDLSAIPHPGNLIQLGQYLLNLSAIQCPVQIAINLISKINISNFESFEAFIDLLDQNKSNWAFKKNANSQSAILEGESFIAYAKQALLNAIGKSGSIDKNLANQLIDPNIHFDIACNFSVKQQGQLMKLLFATEVKYPYHRKQLLTKLCKTLESSFTSVKYTFDDCKDLIELGIKEGIFEIGSFIHQLTILKVFNDNDLQDAINLMINTPFHRSTLLNMLRTEEGFGYIKKDLTPEQQIRLLEKIITEHNENFTTYDANGSKLFTDFIVNLLQQPLVASLAINNATINNFMLRHDAKSLYNTLAKWLDSQYPQIIYRLHDTKNPNIVITPKEIKITDTIIKSSEKVPFTVDTLAKAYLLQAINRNISAIPAEHRSQVFQLLLRDFSIDRLENILNREHHTGSNNKNKPLYDVVSNISDYKADPTEVAKLALLRRGINPYDLGGKIDSLIMRHIETFATIVLNKQEAQQIAPKISSSLDEKTLRTKLAEYVLHPSISQDRARALCKSLLDSKQDFPSRDKVLQREKSLYTGFFGTLQYYFSVRPFWTNASEVKPEGNRISKPDETTLLVKTSDQRIKEVFPQGPSPRVDATEDSTVTAAQQQASSELQPEQAEHSSLPEEDHRPTVSVK